MCGVELLRALPTRLVPGDSYDIRLTLSEFPASAGWMLRWTLAGPQVLTIESAADGDAHVLTLTVTDTAKLTAGTYGDQLRAVRAPYVRTIPGAGVVRVDADLSALQAGEHTGPAYWDQLIADCDKALAGRVQTGGMSMYMLAGRQVMVESMDQLRRIRAWAVAERARIRRGGSAFGKVRVNLLRGW